MQVKLSPQTVLVVLVKLFANFIPLSGLLFWGWNVFSILLLFWVEGFILILLGLYYFFFILQFGDTPDSFKSDFWDFILKLFFAAFIMVFLLAILVVQVSAIKANYNKFSGEDFQMISFYDVWGHLNQIPLVFTKIIPYQISREPTLLFALLASVVNYILLFLHLGKESVNISITYRYFGSVISVFVIALFTWWMLNDQGNEEAVAWSFRVALFFVIVKISLELSPYLFGKKSPLKV